MEDSASRRMGIIAGSSLRKTMASGILGGSVCSLIEWDEVEERNLAPQEY